MALNLHRMQTKCRVASHSTGREDGGCVHSHGRHTHTCRPVLSLASAPRPRPGFATPRLSDSGQGSSQLLNRLKWCVGKYLGCDYTTRLSLWPSGQQLGDREGSQATEHRAEKAL